MLTCTWILPLGAVLLGCAAALGAATGPAPSSRPIIYTRSDPATHPPTSTRPETAPSTATHPATATRPSSHAATGAGDLDLRATIGNVTINLPAGWALNAGGKYLIEAHPELADKDNTGSFKPSISIQQITLTSTVRGTANQADMALGTSQQTLTAKQETGYQAMEKPAAVVISGINGVKFGGTFKRGTVELRSREYLLARNGEAYRIEFTSLNSKWPAYQKLIEKSVATFMLKK